jgi:hypothetical protein
MHIKEDNLIAWANAELDRLLVGALDAIDEEGRQQIIRLINERFKKAQQQGRGKEQFITFCAMRGMAHALKLWEEQHAVSG